MKKIIRTIKWFFKKLYLENCTECGKLIYDKANQYMEADLRSVFTEPHFHFHNRCWEKWNEKRFSLPY